MATRKRPKKAQAPKPTSPGFGVQDKFPAPKKGN